YCSKLELINLCFADDLFLFAHGDTDSVKVIKEALVEFKEALGLVPSLPKRCLSVKYFGVPLVTSRLVFRDCKEFIEKVQARVDDWKNKFLSVAGFLWCHGSMRKGRAKVAWEVVCLPKEEGGLGVRRLDLFNKALMISHVWKLLSRKESLWVKWMYMYKLKERNF
ncbi:hypothetical protein Tco_0816935, partial [Tanacetum coccineum]